MRPQTPSSDLKGKSKDVTLIPNATLNAGEVVFKSDRDHDGMPDEDEIRNGTNPDDPSDADADNDGDGLSNGEEVAMGTDPNAGDSDGDGISDARKCGRASALPMQTVSPRAVRFRAHIRLCDLRPRQSCPAIRISAAIAISV